VLKYSWCLIFESGNMLAKNLAYFRKGPMGQGSFFGARVSHRADVAKRIRRERAMASLCGSDASMRNARRRRAISAAA